MTEKCQNIEEAGGNMKSMPCSGYTEESGAEAPRMFPEEIE